MSLSIKFPFVMPDVLRKSTVATLCIVCAVLFCCSCQNKNEDDPSYQIVYADGNKISLKGTKWKLAGIVDTQTGTIKVLKPESCAGCYTLKFNTNTSAIAHSINMTVKLGSGKDEIQNYFLLEERYEKDGQCYFDSSTFRDAIANANSVKVSRNELRIFYRERYCYLWFKPF